MGNQPLFADRADAGSILAANLLYFRGPTTVVLGLLRGGVLVAFEVALALDAPLDTCVVSKLHPAGRPEQDLGSVVEGGIVYERRDLAASYGVHDRQLQDLVHQKRAEVSERAQRLRSGREPLAVRGKTVLVVDDGAGRPSTMRAVLRSLRQRGAARLVLAVPVAPIEELSSLLDFADEVVCPFPKAGFVAPELEYARLERTSDEYIATLLQGAAAPPLSDPTAPPPPAHYHS